MERETGEIEKEWTHQFSIEIVVPDRSHGKKSGSIGSKETNENPKSERLELCTLRKRRSIED
ncbi:hypothetical protein SESBI_47016 [Sesbania bispinosa]|nr:hypothetical protein SESBI_47016 [Sesbania bispinosa]